MKQLVITFSIASAFLLCGCAVPSKPDLRIAISGSPGSSLLYIAQEAQLFERYDVHVQLVELNYPCECATAISDRHVDAAVIPYDEFTALEESGSTAGIVMAVAAPCIVDTTLSGEAVETSWKSSSVEVLVGDRAELMQRRQEWQRLLLAYEHARLLMAGEKHLQSQVVAARERRSAESVTSDIERWNIFSIAQQDSLFRLDGRCAEINPKWHGKHLLQAAVSTEFNRFKSRNESAATRDKLR